MAEPGHRERRRHRRYGTWLHATFRTEGTGAGREATVLDVSGGGVLLASEVALPVSTGLRLRIDWGDTQITLEARTVACVAAPDGFRLHIAFTIGALPEVQRFNDLLLSLEHEADADRVSSRRLSRVRLKREVDDPVPLRRWEGPGA